MSALFPSRKDTVRQLTANRRVDVDKIIPFPPHKTRIHDKRYTPYPQWCGRRAYWS